MVTHWYMATKNPAPATSTNSAFLVSGIITPAQEAPSAGTRMLNLGHIVAGFSLRLPEPYLRLTTLVVPARPTTDRTWRATAAMIRLSSSA